jgi:hypothetical protein
MARKAAKTEVEQATATPVSQNGRSEKIDNFLKEKLAPRYYAFWEQFTADIPLPFDKPSSSSGKYHQDTAGMVDNLENHSLDLMLFVDKLARIFGDSREQQHYDVLLLAAALHDIFKYGENNERKHTVKNHDEIAARRVKERGLELGLTEYEVETLYGLILVHPGRWNSTNPGFQPITFTQMQLFLHISDMCAAARILNFD